MIKIYTETEYSDKALEANLSHKKLVKVQEERDIPFEVYEYEKKIIKVPVYNDEGEIIGYEDKEVDDLTKPIMIEVVDPETGETILVHKHHTEYKRELVEYLDIVDFSDEEKRVMLNMMSLTKREVFLALYKDKGILPEQLKAQITNPEALIEFEYAERFYRGNPLIDTIGINLGYSIEDLDYLFTHKELPTNES